uniref:F-box domain-containing protein n=1 Tax=Leersia perrieri TaxID=77586 RepID=A0A0D9X974_9ORYZ
MKRKREKAAATVDGEITAAAAPPGSAAAASSSESAAAICDDVIRNIFARLPARDAVASMVLSRHHRRLITSPDFHRLHCLHGEPLPRPHIALWMRVLATDHGTSTVYAPGIREFHSPGADTRPAASNHYQPAETSWKTWRYHGFVEVPRQITTSWRYHGFHVAGDGRRHGTTDPMRALAGRKYNDHRYVGTCNGVILLADEKEPSVGLLLNPAIADGKREVTLVPSLRPARGKPPTEKFHILGFGYGPRTKTYKLVACKHKLFTKFNTYTNAGSFHYWRPMYSWRADKLVVYSLSNLTEQPRTVLAGLGGDTIRCRSLYLDGMVYLLIVDKGTVLAFDVDDETITSTNLPGKRVVGSETGSLHLKSELMEMSGRLCVATVDDGDERCIAVWLLSEDRRWEQRCLFFNGMCRWGDLAGVWNCDGVLLIFMQTSNKNRILLYDDARDDLYYIKTPPNASPEKMDYRIWWGYKPTLVSPANIVGELSQDEQRLRDLTASLDALKPVDEMDKRNGHDAALHTVCFMEFLVGIMRKLPDQLDHGIVTLHRFY